MIRLLLFLTLFAGVRGTVLAQAYAFSVLAGQAGNVGKADGTGGAAQFNRPQGIAVDAGGTIYIADTVNCTLRKMSPSGSVTTWVGEAGMNGTNDGVGPAARLSFPTGLAFDAGGTLWVVDTGARAIRRITPDGAVTTMVRGLVWPTGIAVDRAGNVFFVDLAAGDGPRQLRKMNPGGAVSIVADRVGSPATFSRMALAVDPDGSVYAVDEYGDTVQKITADGQITTLAGYAGQPGTTDGAGGNARLNGPAGIALDASGNLFITDSATTIRRVSRNGDVTTLAGQFGQKGVRDGVGGAAQFDEPTAIAVDAAGNLYVTDTGSHTIRKGALTTAISPPIVSTARGALAQNIATNGTAVFTVAASGSALRFQWSKNGTPLPGATTATLTLARVTAADDGDYAVVVSNSAGSVELFAGALAVHDTALTSFTLRHERPGAGMLWSIASGNGRLVAVGDGGAILTSTDGRTWTRPVSGTTDWLVGVTFGAGRFIAVGDRGIILGSADGVTWSRAAVSGTTQRLNNVIYAAGLFAAVGEAGTIVTSPDGQTWTARSSGVSGWLRGLAYNPAAQTRNYTSYFVFPDTATSAGPTLASFVAGGQGGVVLTSPDGLTWTREYASTALDLESLIAVPGVANFAGIGQNGTAISGRRFGYVNSRIMPTGYYYQFRFAPTPTGASVRLRGLAEGAGALFATGENGTVLAAPDVSGPWTQIAVGTNANLVGGVFHGNTLYLVGAGETILQSDPLYATRLINISTRGAVGTGGNALISGFVITGPQRKEVLVRAAGPALGGFGLQGTLPAPVLTLFDGASRPIATNTRWGTAANAATIAGTASRVGAFPFAAGSADSALLLTLEPGAYTAQISPGSGVPGLSLVEVYDADALSNERSRAINISTRGQVAAGDGKLIAGFVVTGAASRRVLIRAIGPTLADFGLSGALPTPQLELFDHRGALQQRATAWSERPDADELRSAAVLAGAFALPNGSRDAALVTTLLPGAYTVQVSGLNNATGLALVEVYDLP